MKILHRLSRYPAFEIRQGRGEVAHVDRRNSATMEGIGRVSARRDCLVIALACLRKLAFFQVQSREFFVVTGGRVVKNRRLQFMDAPAPGEYLEGMPQ